MPTNTSHTEKKITQLDTSYAIVGPSELNCAEVSVSKGGRGHSEDEPAEFSSIRGLSAPRLSPWL